MVKSSVHIDPKIINLNIEKPGYQAIQEKCEKSDDVILNSGTGVPLYVQATKIPSNDEVYNWQCSSMYDGPVFNLQYQPIQDNENTDWACCGYKLTTDPGKQHVLFLPKSMKKESKDILSIYELEAQLVTHKNKLKEIESNLKNARDGDNSCTNMCGNRELYIEKPPVLNPLTEQNTSSFKPTVCTENKGYYGSQISGINNNQNKQLYTNDIIGQQTLICCGKNDQEKYWIPLSKIGGNNYPTNPITGFITKDDIERCKNGTKRIAELEKKQKEELDKINIIISQLVSIGDKVSAGSETYDACYNYLQHNTDYTKLYEELNKENVKIKTMLDKIHELEAGSKISKEGIISEIYQYVVYLISMVLLIGICVLLLSPALQKKLGINFKEMAAKQKNSFMQMFKKDK